MSKINITKFSYAMSNDELMDAIRVTNDLLRETPQASDIYMKLSIHLDALLSSQAVRANTMETNRMEE